MRTTDLFAGLGGASTGAEQAGATVVAAVNHNADAIKWHRANHPRAVHIEQDVNELDMRALPEHDLLLASPSCVGFSPSGRPGQSTAHRVNRDKVLAQRATARGTAWAVIRAAEVQRPEAIVVENVREFLEWELFDAWRGCLEAMGYAVQGEVVDAWHYGSSQSRQRTIVTARQGRALPIPAPSRWPRRSLGGDLHPDHHPECRWMPLAEKSQSIQDRVARARAQSPDPERGVWFNVDAARFRDPDRDPWPTLTTRSLSQGMVVNGDRVRRVEARELARAQGLPDDYRIPSGRTVAGRLIGNMIPVPLSRTMVQAVMA